MTILKKYPITLLLTTLISTVFVAMLIQHPRSLENPLVIYRFGGLVGDVLKNNLNDIWRLVSPIFVHIGWEHFLFNAITLFFLGQLTENIYGRMRFLLLFLLSGIMGNVFVLWLTPDVVVAGASTALFGLFSAVIVTGYFSKSSYLKSLSSTYQILILINLIFNLITPNVSIVGHLGGLLGGLLLGISFSPKKTTTLSTFTKTIAFVVYLTILLSLLKLSLPI